MSLCHSSGIAMVPQPQLLPVEYPVPEGICNTHRDEEKHKVLIQQEISVCCPLVLTHSPVCLAHVLPYTAAKRQEAALCWTASLSQVWISFAPTYKVLENFLVSCKTTFKEKKTFKK